MAPGRTHTHTRTRTRTRRWTAIPVTALLLLATACGGSSGADRASPSAPTDSSSSNPPAVEADPAITAMLPDDVREAGTIPVATEALYPPYEYLAEDGTTIIGLDIELLDAVTQRIGIKYDLSNSAFDGLLSGLASGRYRVIAAAISDTKERQAQYDFADYFQAGQAIVVPVGNPEGINDVADLCGRPVAVLATSAQEALLMQSNAAECANDPIKITSLPSDTDALLQVQSGRAQASYTQEPVGRYNAERIGDGNAFEVANSETLAPNPLGYVFTKQDTQLRDTFQAALQSLIDDGTYQQILDRRDLGSGALDEATINGGTA